MYVTHLCQAEYHLDRAALLLPPEDQAFLMGMLERSMRLLSPLYECGKIELIALIWRWFQSFDGQGTTNCKAGSQQHIKGTSRPSSGNDMSSAMPFFRNLQLQILPGEFGCGGVPSST